MKMPKVGDFCKTILPPLADSFNNTYSLWQLDGDQHSFRSAASFGFGG
jgi:hypothetical protein